MEEKLKAFGELLDVVYELRQKCPWDKEQTWETLRPLTIEESYELTDAVLSGDRDQIKKELGDVLLHILFYGMFGEEEGAFDIGEVCRALRAKLIQRHPHIYGDVQAEDSAAVKKNWEQIKLKEGHKSVLAGVPKSLPSLIKASRLQEKAASVGFDWANREDVWLKVEEEMKEFHDAALAGNKEEEEAEFGDLLFSLINYARFVNINPDNALERTNLKFIGRFTYLEEQATAQGLQLKDMTLEEMDKFWNEAKTKK